MKIRHLIISTIIPTLFALFFACQVQAQDEEETRSTNSKADTFYDDINDTSKPSISVPTGMVIRSLDENGDPVEFVPDEINRALTITGTTTLQYDTKSSANTALKDGIAFYLQVGDSGVLTFAGAAEISGGYSGDSGDLGVIYVYDGGTLQFNNDANLHDNIGGGIAAETATINFKKLTMVNNYTISESGGTLYLYESQTTVDGIALFTDNKAGYDPDAKTYGGGGGAIFVYDGTLDFKNTATFGTTASNGNKAAEGGAVYLSAGTLTFSNTTTFQSNEALAGHGGALYQTGGTANFNGTTDFKNNTATGNDSVGGAIYAEQEALITFAAGKTVTFNGNESAAHGGAVYADSSTLEFDGETIFTVNKASYAGENADDYGGGGAMYINGSHVGFNGATTFGGTAANSGNKADSGMGGALFITGSGDEDESFVQFNQGVTITGNSAKYGGAIAISNSAISFGDHSTISGNSATESGGAIYAFDGLSVLNVADGKSLTITENSVGSGKKGGAVFVADGAELILRTGGNKASLTIEKSDSGKNDVYLDGTATLTLDVAANGALSINSALSSTLDGAAIIKRGEGTVNFTGNASDYSGNLTVDEGKFSITGSSSHFGNLDSTVIEVANGASIIVRADDNTPNPGNNMGLLRASEVILSEGGLVFSTQMVVETENDDPAKYGYALLTLKREDSTLEEMEEFFEEEYFKTGFIVSDDSLDVQKRVEKLDDNYTLYVWTKFDPNDPETEWEFKKTIDLSSYTLNNLSPATNNRKGLTVTGTGTVKLSTGDNKVNWLKGDDKNSILEIQKSLEVNGAGLSATDPKIYEYEGKLKGESSSTFIKKGDYTQVLTGDNSDFKGSMIVDEGKLKGNSNSFVGNITISKTDDKTGTLEFDQTTIKNGTFAGSLNGNGNLLINGDVQDLGAAGDSVLIVKGNNSSFTGQTTVNTGWLVLDEGSNFSKTNITVNENGGFGGTGHVQSVYVQNGGAVQAYNGVLTIDGNLKFEDGGKMYVFVDPTEIGGLNKDYIAAGDNSTVDFTGAKIEIVGLADGYTEGTSFQLTTGNVTGLDLSQEYVYTDKVSGKEWTFTFTQDADGNYVATGTSGGGGGEQIIVGLPWNQSQVAASLKTAAVNSEATQEMKEFITKLNTFKGGTDENPTYQQAYLDAVQQLAGSVRANGIQLGLYSPYRTVFNRLSLGSELYNGGAPIIYNNGYGPVSGIQYRGAGVGETYRGQYDQVNPHTGAETPTCDIPCYFGENNFWADVTHIQTKTKSDGNSSAYGISRTGLLIGLDVQKRIDSRFGFLFGYFAPYLWQDGDRVEADDYHAAMYLQKNYAGTDIYGYFGYAHQQYESRRFVDMSKIGDYGVHRYDGKTSGDSFSMSVEVSKPRYYGSNTILRPLIGFDYILTSQKGYDEHGNGDATDLFGLRYDRAQYDQLLVRLGLNLKRDSVRSTTNFRLQYINQFASDPYPSGNARLLTASDANMNIHGVNLGRDYLNFGFGLNVFMNEARSRFVSFDYDLNTSRRTTAHGLSLILVERF